jgi:hypothetical protein
LTPEHVKDNYDRRRRAKQNAMPFGTPPSGRDLRSESQQDVRLADNNKKAAKRIRRRSRSRKHEAAALKRLNGSGGRKKKRTRKKKRRN